MFSAALILALSAACGSHNDSGINPSADFAIYIKAYTGDIVTTSSTIRIELQASPQILPQKQRMAGMLHRASEQPIKQ
jgi:hypothetical protein